MEPTKKQIANGCKWFNGVQNDKCEAGIAYSSFKVRHPCLPNLLFGQPADQCPLFEFETEEEIEATEKAGIEAAQNWINALASGLCPDCGQNVEPRRQVGRCVYGACGHRLFQGKL